MAVRRVAETLSFVKGGRACDCTILSALTKLGCEVGKRDCFNRKSVRFRNDSLGGGVMEEHEAQLIGEQIARLRDNLQARFERDEAALIHQAQLTGSKLEALAGALEQERQVQADHENRLRRMDDEVIGMRSTGSLLQAGQALLTLIASAIAAWLGGTR